MFGRVGSTVTPTRVICCDELPDGRRRTPSTVSQLAARRPSIAIEDSNCQSEDVANGRRGHMDVAYSVNQAFERVLEFIRARILVWLLNPEMGKVGENIGQWIILLFFSCFIRPSDLTGESPVQLTFKRFGILYALAPAGLYALANVEMFKHFIVAKLPPLPPNSPSAELILFLWMNKIMYGLAFVLVLSTTYLFGLTRWAYNQLICRLLGPTLANVQRASLAYFLLKIMRRHGNLFTICLDICLYRNT
jgi:hypothetical protein